MHEKHLYEYGVIRIVPRVEREEFINAGVIVFCKKQKFLRCIWELNKAKIISLHHDADLLILSRNLEAFAAIAAGEKDCKSPIARLDPPERFRWLTATRSTLIQVGKIHSGLTADLPEITERLFQKMVR